MKKGLLWILIVGCLFCACTSKQASIEIEKELTPEVKDIEVGNNSQTVNPDKIGTETIEETMCFPDKYLFNSTELDGRLVISVDANVHVPAVAEMPIIRVKKSRFSQELINKIVKILFADDPIFDYTQPNEPFFDGQLRPFISADQGDTGFLRLDIGSAKIAEKDNIDTIKEMSGWISATEEAFLASEMEFISFRTYSKHGITISSNMETQDADINSHSFQTIKALGDAFFSALGLDDAYKLGYASEIKGTSAYNLYYTSYVSGIETFVSKDRKDYTDEEEYPARWGYETILLVVSEEGIQSLRWDNPMEILTSVSDVTNLLPFPDIQTLFERDIQEVYTEEMSLFGGSKGFLILFLTDVRLCLMRVRGQDGNIPDGTLVPAWVFYGRNQMTFSDGVIEYNFTKGSGSTVTTDPYPVLILNAMDGTRIDLDK